MGPIRLIGDKLLKNIADTQYIHYPYVDDSVQIVYLLGEYVRIFNSIGVTNFETMSVAEINYIKHVFERVNDFLPSLLEIPPEVAMEPACYLKRYFTSTIIMTYPVAALNNLSLKTQHLEKYQNILDSIKTFMNTHMYHIIVDSSNNVERINMITDMYQHALDENYRTYVWVHKILERGSNLKMQKILK